jgi:hypothetical protein
MNEKIKEILAKNTGEVREAQLKILEVVKECAEEMKRPRTCHCPGIERRPCEKHPDSWIRVAQNICVDEFKKMLS